MLSAVAHLLSALQDLTFTRRLYFEPSARSNTAAHGELCAGCLPHVSEGRGESHPAASGPERAASEARPNGSAHHHLSNGHGGAHAPPGRPSGHADVLSGEDSAPDDGPAVTSPATGSTPGAYFPFKLMPDLSCTRLHQPLMIVHP